MANADKSITEFPNGTLTENSLFPAADVNAGTGYANTKHSASAMGAGMCGEDFTYNALETGNKSIFAAINELNSIGAYKTVTGTLTAGQTSITLQDADIKEDSLLTFYTNVLGVNPISESHTNGSVTLTFDEQASDMVVGVNIMGAHGGGGVDLEGTLNYQLRTGRQWEYITVDLTDVVLFRMDCPDNDRDYLVDPRDLPTYTGGSDVYKTIFTCNGVACNMSLTTTGYRISINGNAYDVDVYLVYGE